MIWRGGGLCRLGVVGGALVRLAGEWDTEGAE